MAEKEEAAGKKSWWKGILGAIGGMISGVVIMYLTPWVDKVAKPAKPLANFSVTADGTTVHFQNQSQPRGDGWWDFGDGSPLVPVSTDSEFINHTYPRLGDYTAKMSLRNQLGEEDDRSVPIHIDGKPAAEAPQVVSLQAVPAHQCDKGGVVYAPATFRLVSKVEHADVCMLDLGNDRPCELVTDPAVARCHHVTFDKPGRYVVKLIAIHGSQHDERTATVPSRRRRRTASPPSSLSRTTRRASRRPTARRTSASLFRLMCSATFLHSKDTSPRRPATRLRTSGFQPRSRLGERYAWEMRWQWPSTPLRWPSVRRRS